MKKLVTILGSIGLIATTGITVVACKMPIELKQKLEEPKEEKSNTEKQPEVESKKEKQPETQNYDKDNAKYKENHEPKMQSDESKNDNSLERDNVENNGRNKSNESDVSSSIDEQPQGDEPGQDEKQAKRKSEENIELIKKYGEELTNILESSMDKLQENDSEENANILAPATELLKAYGQLKQFSSFNEFEAKLKEEKKGTLDSDFISKLEQQWDKIVNDYERAKDKILKLLK
uniref:Lipoprotein n=1 Tax=Mycoplasma feriruminatoris TaxID=1179777 RepID=A0A654IPU1_9MOLU|nr:hypothetical protein MF5582_00647 [Mycoplasma feriruminatoris]